MSQRVLSKHSESTKKALREYLKRERYQSDFIIPSEPKILRLAYFLSISSTKFQNLFLDAICSK